MDDRAQAAWINEVDGVARIQIQDQPGVFDLVIASVQAQPSRHAKVDDQIATVSKMDNDMLSAAFHRRNRCPSQLGSIQIETIIEYFNTIDGHPSDRLQAADEGLDFRELRNGLLTSFFLW